MAVSHFWNDYKRPIGWALYAIAIVASIAWLGPIIGDQKASRLVQSTISGILVGGIYALTGLGIVIVTKASGVFNFAHGFMMVIGGLIFWSFFTTAEVPVASAAALAFFTSAMFLTTSIQEAPSGFWKTAPNNLIGKFFFWSGKKMGIAQLTRPEVFIRLLLATAGLTFLMTYGDGNWRWVHAFVGTVSGAILLGLIIERFTIRPLVGQPLFAMILMTLAVTEILQGFVQFTWGPLDRTLPLFEGLKNTSIPMPIRIDAKESLGGMIIVRTELAFAFILALLAVGGFILFFRYAQIGLAMRAVSEDQQLAQSVGLRVRSILAAVWAIAAILAAIAGVLHGGATSMTPAISLVALRAFPAVLLGGLESIEGVLVGGIVVGLVEQWANLLFPGTQAGPELAPYIVLMIVLIVRPEGLFGQEIIERI